MEDGRQRSNGETPGEQTADLGLRLEQSRESLCELQRQWNDLERNLEPRTDAVEARVMALADVTEELSAKLQRTTRCSEDAVTKTWSPGEDVAAAWERAKLRLNIFAHSWTFDPRRSR